MNRFLFFSICLFCFTCCPGFVSAQVEKGNYILGGSAGLDHLTNNYGNNVTTLNISPLYGSFLSDHFLIGGRANLNYQKAYGQPNMSIKAGPLMRYYFSNMIFVQVDYSLGVPSRSYSYTEHDIYARLGYALFLNDHVAIEPYIYAGYRDLVYRWQTLGYQDYGIYFSIQVYLESALNKALKIHGTKMKQN